jgi:WD40 repeat protein
MSYSAGIVVPPSPNWYSSHVSDAGGDGKLYAYASQNYVVILCSVTGRILHQLAGHKGRVTCLAFLKRSFLKQFLVTGSTDKTLILWDGDTGKPIRAMSGHRSEIKGISIFQERPRTHTRERGSRANGQEEEDSSSSSSVVGSSTTAKADQRKHPDPFAGDFVSVDKSGWAFTWSLCNSDKPVHKIQLPNSFSGALCTFTLGPEPYSSSIMSGKDDGPNNKDDPSLLENCICYGTTKGQVGLVDVTSGAEVQGWQPHSREVCQVRSWYSRALACLLLMTTSKNGEAKLHVAAGKEKGEGSGDDRTTEVIFKPLVALGSHQKLTSSEEFRNWTSCLFSLSDSNRQSIYLTNLKGQIYKWSLGATKDFQLEVNGPHIIYHNRPIFRLDALPGGSILSCSMDRQVACFHEEDKSSLCWAFRGFGAHSQFVCASPTTGKLAVGCGDSTVRLYDDISLQAQAPQTSSAKDFAKIMKEKKFLWNGLQKMSFRWISFHPKHETLIVFATEAGSLGVYDMVLEKVAYLSSEKLKAIQSLCWRNEAAAGNNLNSNGMDTSWDSTTLYMLHSGKLCAWHRDIKQWADMHSSKVYDEVRLEPCLANPSHQVSAFQWSACGRYLLLASEVNSMSLCCDSGRQEGPTHLRSVHRMLSSSESLITCLRVMQDGGGGGEKEHLKVFAGHQDGKIFVESLHLLRSSGERGEEVSCISISSLVLDAHKHNITGIVISPFTNHWASISHGESCIKVWSEDLPRSSSSSSEGGATMKSNPCIVLQGHHANVLSICWSKVNARLLYSVSEDQAMRAWQIVN